MDDRYEPFVPAPADGVTAERRSSWFPWRDMSVCVEHVGAPDAPVRLVLLHGAGGNAAAMWPFASRFAALGAHVTVPDLPGYGLTRVADRAGVRYEHWRDVVADLVRAEADDRPLVLLGASMGGLLAYDVAAATGLASSLVVTCLLDPRERDVRARLSWHPLLGALAGPVLHVAAGPLARVQVPIRWIADMRHISNDPRLVRAVVRDRAGGGGRMPLGWMRSFLEWVPAVEPEELTGTPVLMAHPALDRWTPLAISARFFDRISAPTELVLLDGAGHFPVEQPGFDQLLAAVARVVGGLTHPDAAPAAVPA
ncbi:alpha/beta hydrolase [Georgenia sp. MJ206]|uniref:alpha/beta hydrolase n=1 Tax=Georgenia wangjunii TaxID=3117730 RepID=UPI002F25F1D4